MVAQGKVRVGWGSRVGLAALLASAPTAAWADALVAPGGQLLSIDAQRVILVHQGSTEVLVEALEVRSTHSRTLWLKAFGAEARPMPVAEAPFAEVRAGTRVGEPFHRQVRSRVFGPSVVTALTNKLMADPDPAPAEVEEQGELRQLEVAAQEMFSGTVYTSTITRTYVLPAEMQAWLHLQGFTLTEDLKADLATHFNRGARVMATVLTDSGPTPDVPARVGPFQMQLETATPLYPSLRRSGAGPDKAQYEFFVVGAVPLVPTSYPTLWDEEAWAPPPAQRSQFDTRFARALSPTEPMALDLEQRQGIVLPEPAVLLYSRFRQGDEALGEVTFEPAPAMVEIPGRGRQGSLLDLFLCLLLGLAPLIYTPESWFLLWLGSRARDRIRHGESALGHWLWPIYALVVAGYWAFTLSGAARVAAALPLVVAVVRLGIPERPARLSRVRVEFKKKKKAR